MATGEPSPVLVREHLGHCHDFDNGPDDDDDRSDDDNDGPDNNHDSLHGMLAVKRLLPSDLLKPDFPVCGL